jgi:nicotinic acid mononucleotide adenylyltransferase
MPMRSDKNGFGRVMTILENLLSNENSLLKSKTICYYPGSFDPLHKGHECIAREVARRGFCDFVLIFAVWGDDRYKKRSDTNFRIDMLFSAFEDDPSVIVTRYNPFQLQNALTTPNSADEKFVVPKYENKFVGLLGSDTALFYDNHEEFLRDFMRGIRLNRVSPFSEAPKPCPSSSSEAKDPENFGDRYVDPSSDSVRLKDDDLWREMKSPRLKEKDDPDEVFRGDICLPIDSFIVADRDGFPFSKDEMPDGRKIIGRLDVGKKYPIASENIRKAIVEGKDASQFLSSNIVELIEKRVLTNGGTF